MILENFLSKSHRKIKEFMKIFNTNMVLMEYILTGIIQSSEMDANKDFLCFQFYQEMYAQTKGIIHRL